MASLAPHDAPTSPLYRIHHYPAGLIETRALGSLGLLTLRPVLPQDDRLLASLVASLSPQARRFRFHGHGALSSSQVQQMCGVDYREQLALVITTQQDGIEWMLADARYSVDADGEGAEFALLVDEAWQGHGLGRWAMAALQRAADAAGLQWLHGQVLQANTPMRALMRRCGFALSPDAEDEQVLHAQRRLGNNVVALPPLGPSRAPRVLSWLRRALPRNVI